ncbi:MAG: hypothetical protein NVSMB56_01650 [Pyrinomonadaceae bacterium]
MKNSEENTFKLIEMNTTHSVTTPGGYDYYMGIQYEDVESTVSRHYYLAVPSKWYPNDAFDELAKDKIYEALFSSVNRNFDSVNIDWKKRSFDIDISQLNPDAIDAAQWEDNFYIFQGDYSCKYLSLAEFKDFMQQAAFVSRKNE